MAIVQGLLATHYGKRYPPIFSFAYSRVVHVVLNEYSTLLPFPKRLQTYTVLFSVESQHLGILRL
jgi:hypothetical protein